MKRLNLMLYSTLSAFSTVAGASAPDTEAVEYYNAFTKHYFVTATASEARLIDTGAAGKGWLRTGRSFQAWIKKADAPPNAQPVCRFYSSGANSHFYTASGGECEGLKAAQIAERSRGAASGWQYEGIAFYIQAPSAGQCPAGTAEMLRVYNNGFANGAGSNHRFVDDAGLQELMVESKWLSEGTVFCAATKSTGTGANLPPTTRKFETLVGTWKGDAQWEIAQGNKEAESARPLELKLAADGAITGTGYGCSFTGKVALGDGFRSFFTGSVTASGCTDTAFNGEYLRLKLQRFGADTLMVKMKRGEDDHEVSISARLTNGSATAPVTPPGFDSVAGEWVGTVGWEAGPQSAQDEQVETNRPLTLKISSTGTLTGTGFGCTFTGTLVPSKDWHPGFTGEITAAGCENTLFNGKFADVRVERDGSGKLEIEFKRKSDAMQVQIEGALQAKDAGTAPAPAAPADPVVVGKWQGKVIWSAGAASGSDAVSFTIGADGAFSGSGFGCKLAGSLKLAMNGRAVTGGTITASGCTKEALNVTFTNIAFEREDADALEFAFEREVNGVKVKLKGKATRVAG
jgi:hypothetical protein